MSVTEILEELPKLNSDERQLLWNRLSELESCEVEETPELLAAIDEALASPRENDVTAEQIRENVKRWVSSK